MIRRGALAIAGLSPSVACSSFLGAAGSALARWVWGGRRLPWGLVGGLVWFGDECSQVLNN